MKRNRLAILISIALFSSALTFTPADAAGRSASSIPNTILNGKGAPASSVGHYLKTCKDQQVQRV
ncbi:MAG: hypothetical protein NTW39_03825 [Actinobacteria bacterium]|nr:hypothetical protein [Actinomycetota bacterium]